MIQFHEHIFQMGGSTTKKKDGHVCRLSSNKFPPQAGYVTTIEEYQHQRYEGGSTAYGPHTHGARVAFGEMINGVSWFP